MEALPRPLIFRVSKVGRNAANVSIVILLMKPGPTTPKTFASFFASSFTPTPGIAAVRYALMRFAERNAFGAPVSLSFRMTIRMERGKPFSRFSTLEPYHFTPAISNFPPKYAGIAMNRLSGPFFGMFGNSGLSGKLIMQP